MKYNWRTLTYVPDDSAFGGTMYDNPDGIAVIKITTQSRNGDTAVNTLKNDYYGNFISKIVIKETLISFDGEGKSKTRTRTETHKFKLDYVKFLIKSALENKYSLPVSEVKYLTWNDYKSKNELNGHHTRAPAKKHTPAVRVNVRKMF